MIDTSSCVRYILPEDINSVNEKLITWLSDNYPDIFLIHQESYSEHNWILTKQTLIHRHWGATMMMEIFPIDSNQTLILIPAPPDPDLEDVSHYEDRILEHQSGSFASIRLALVDGNDEKASSLIRNVLREQRHHSWMQVQAGLRRSLRLEFIEGNHEDLIRDITNDNRDMKSVNSSPSRDESMVLELWVKGHTAKQIALRMGRTEKTILNRLTLMRKAYGEQLVPRRRMA